MYEAYWDLKEKPFENTPDPRYLYHSPKHEEALSRMLYVVTERKGAALLTGEYGSGKTLLSRVFLRELSSESYRTALIFNPALSPVELIKEIIYQLNGKVDTSSLSKNDLLRYFNEILYRNLNENKETVIVIDEAQAIPEESTFEELRLLLNFQSDNKFLFSLILIGQPELKERLRNLPQLKQRLAVRFHLTAFARDEAVEYIRHRLSVAGRQEQIFTEEALDEIYKFSGGIPRKINNICDMALLVSYGEAQDKIDTGVIKKVVEDLEDTTVDIGVKVRI